MLIDKLITFVAPPRLAPRLAPCATWTRPCGLAPRRPLAAAPRGGLTGYPGGQLYGPYGWVLTRSYGRIRAVSQNLRNQLGLLSLFLSCLA